MNCENMLKSSQEKKDLKEKSTKKTIQETIRSILEQRKFKRFNILKQSTKKPIATIGGHVNYQNDHTLAPPNPPSPPFPPPPQKKQYEAEHFFSGHTKQRTSRYSGQTSQESAKS